MNQYAIAWIGDDKEDKGNILEAGSWDEAQALADDLGVDLCGKIEPWN